MKRFVVVRKGKNVYDKYLRDLPGATRPGIEGRNDSKCPNCFNGQLVRDDEDIACLSCGWRESEYLSRDKKS